jgi:hypothetical protein
MDDPMADYLADLERRQKQPAPQAGPAPVPEQVAPPMAIPYVDHHTGARRWLQFNLTSGNATLKAKIPPIVSIDGRQYLVYWGTMTFEIPADRPVHVSVHVEGERIGQAASALLPPGDSLTLTYATNYMSGVATLR